MINKKPELVIFDMDGLMFDTERLSHEAWTRTGEENGFRYTMDITRKKLGLGKKGVRALFPSILEPARPLSSGTAAPMRSNGSLSTSRAPGSLSPGWSAC